VLSEENSGRLDICDTPCQRRRRHESPTLAPMAEGASPSVASKDNGNERNKSALRHRSSLGRIVAIVTGIVAIVAGLVTILTYFEISPSSSNASGQPQQRDPLSRSAVTHDPDCPSQQLPGGSGPVLAQIQEEETITSYCWAQYLAPVNPGETLAYIITYENLSKTVQDQVIVRVMLMGSVLLLPGTTKVADGSHPKGISIPSNDVDEGGIDLGNFESGATAYVTFQVAMPGADDLQCGWTTEASKAIVTLEGEAGYHYSYVYADVDKVC
jgi:hypothetical protein